MLRSVPDPKTLYIVTAVALGAVGLFSLLVWRNVKEPWARQVGGVTEEESVIPKTDEASPSAPTSSSEDA